MLRGLAQPGPPGLAGPFLGYRYAPGYQHAGAGPEWEGRRHALEAAFWAAHLQEFEACLARLRRIRGDARATRLVRDVLAEVEAAQGTEAALLERGLLLQRWRENAYGGGRERAAEGTVKLQRYQPKSEHKGRPEGLQRSLIACHFRSNRSLTGVWKTKPYRLRLSAGGFSRPSAAAPCSRR